ncbi:MAG: hypothetical protein FK733_02105 [Asgard group archaeon]|nr:hypothetical protein [Asgard group archaeon]
MAFKTAEYRTLDVINENKKEIMIWQIVGGIVIFGLGALWHFIFEWTNGWAPIGWILPVNESVWEHVKLMYWPALIFYVIEGIFLYKKTNNFIFAKFVGFYGIPIMSISIFYVVYGAFGFESFIFDTIVLGILIGIQQFVSYKLLTREPVAGEKYNVLMIVSIVFIAILGILLIVFTYVTPHIPFFEHVFSEQTGEYGILDHYGDHDH